MRDWCGAALKWARSEGCCASLFGDRYESDHDVSIVWLITTMYINTTALTSTREIFKHLLQHTYRDPCTLCYGCALGSGSACMARREMQNFKCYHPLKVKPS
eukprot:3409-Heterococcus_DN1.PRE.2